MRFKNIIGQDKIKKRLLNSVSENRVSHALLLSGTSGTGKLAIAIAYAQYLSCSNKTDHDSCGECLSCKKYEKLIHPDLHFVFPVFSSPKNDKPVSDNYIKEWRELINEDPYITLNQWLSYIGSENKQGIINTHESSEILRKLNLKAFESEYKIMIIWQADKMNPTAANKLLKLIEEPPQKTVFILTTENQDHMLKTIASRTQIIGVPGIDNESLANEISIRYNLSKEESENFTHLASGSFVRAKNLITESDQNIENFEFFTQLMRLSYQKNVIDLQKLVDEIHNIGREKQKSFLEYSLRLIRENFILKSHPKELSYLTGEELKFSEKFSPFIKDENIQGLYEEFNNAYFHIERNGYAKLVFFDLSLKIIKLIKQ